MSGSPKYSRAELNRQRQAKLQAERQRRAEQEAQQRQEAEERERQRQLKAAQQGDRQRLHELWGQIQGQTELVYDRQFQELQQQVEALQGQINGAHQIADLASVAGRISQLQHQWQHAKQQKWQDEQEAQRQQEIERQQIALAACEQRLTPWLADAQKFGPQDLASLQHSFQQLRDLIQQGNPQAVQRPLATYQQTLASYLTAVEQAKTQWQAQQALALAELGQIQATIAGLQADPVVMRWQAEVLKALADNQAKATTAIEQEQFEQVRAYLEAVNRAQAEMVATANAAQLKADQRDYIADSIASSLQELGFNIVYRQPEHADHPASAIILGAVTHAGKGISVSVPVDGEIFYDVDGYSKQSVAVVGGGQAAVCDEAEQVIGEMHEVLAAEFGVQMGELEWEGKNPQRQLRQAEHLPRSSGRSARQS